MPNKTVKVVDLKSNCEFADQGGRWTAHFPLFDLRSEGATEDEAYAGLRERLGEVLGDGDESVIEKWKEFAAANTSEREMTDEEVRAEEELLENSHAAYAGLEAVTYENLDDFIASSKPALVDFWAEWCKPCHMMSPILKEVADGLADRLSVGALDVDANEGVREKFGILGIPTMILFKEGQELTRLIGTRPAEQLRSELEPFLS